MPGVAYNFVPVDREQLMLMPPSVSDWLPEDHFAWFVLDVVEELDLSGVHGRASVRWSRRRGVSPGDDGGAAGVRVLESVNVRAARSSGGASRTWRSG